MASEQVSKIDVIYDKADNRKIRCFCTVVVDRTIVPHLKKAHPKTWEAWCLDFARLLNKGWSHRRIMWKYRAIFSWTVIEREARRMVEEGKAKLQVRTKERISQWDPPGFTLETTTVWSFPRRGEWSVHQADYRGNWPPQLPRNLILKYTQPGELVFDPFFGGGTTLIEAYLLGRRSVGIDVNPIAKTICDGRIREMESASNGALEEQLDPKLRPVVIQGDARGSLRLLESKRIGPGTIDLVCTHPPYLDAIRYTEKLAEDLSHIADAEVFCDEIQKIAEQLYTLLKPGGRCAVLIGDVRKNGKTTPLGFKVMERFQRARFEVEEIIIKEQHRDESTEFYFNKNSVNYRLAHEYIFVFLK